ncbi:MAG: cation transporter, partial [Oscillospiraceae bacterium]|nr:cation transporter [Oscillospiraceae bacterium]
MIKTTLKIDGMACTMCESHVNDAVRKVADVSKVSSSYKKGITEIVSAEPLDEK